MTTNQFVVINPNTYRVVILHSHGSTRVFKSVAGAKNALNATIKRLTKLREEFIARFPDSDPDFANSYGEQLAYLDGAKVVDYEPFLKNEPVAIRKDMMSGETYAERLNTPLHMSPSSETYWSM